MAKVKKKREEEKGGASRPGKMGDARRGGCRCDGRATRMGARAGRATVAFIDEEIGLRMREGRKERSNATATAG